MKIKKLVAAVVLIVLALVLNGCNREPGADEPESTAVIALTASPAAAQVTTAAPLPTNSPTPALTARPITSLTATPTLTSTPSLPVRSPADGSTLDLLGHIGGESRALTARDQTLYLGDGTELAILDISDPARPRRAGYVVLPDVVTDIYVVNDYAYVEVNDKGFQVIDVSNPTAPASLGDLETPQAAMELNFNGESAYVAVDGSGHGMYFRDGQARSVIERDGLLFLPDKNGVAIFDVSSPPVAAAVGTIELPGPFQNMALMDNHVYVADTAALRVFDISDPTRPAEIGFYATSAYMQTIYSNPGMGPGCATSSLVVEDNFAYINGCDGNQIVDISDPRQPVRAGSFVNAGPMVVSINGYGFVNGPGSLRIMDLTTAPDLKTVGIYHTPTSQIGAIVMAGSHAFVANPYRGLLVLDVSEPANPVGVGYYASPSYGFGLDAAVQGDYAYVLDNKALHILDVSEVANPVEVGLIKAASSDPFQELSSVTVANDLAYITGRFNDARLWIVDVSDPAVPVEVSADYVLPHGTQDIAVVNSRAYIVTGDGLEVADVSNPEAPVRLDVFQIPGVLWTDVSVAGDYVYLGAMYPNDLHIVDISEPAVLEEAGSYTPAGDGRAITVAGSFAYVLDEYRSGLRVVDISDPTSPSKVAFYELPNPSNFDSIAVTNGTVFAGAGAAGLYIIKHVPAVQ